MGADLKLIVEDGVASIRREGAILAFLDVNLRGRLDKLVLSPGIKPSETEQILRVAVVHSLQTKSAGTALPAPIILGQLAPLSAKDLEKILKDEGVEVIHGTVKLFEMAINAALSGNLEKAGVGFKLCTHSGEECRVKFTVRKGMFQAWHLLDKGSDLYIVPAFHPVMDSRKKSAHMVTSSTGSLGSDSAVRYVHAPFPNLFGGGWEYVEDPFVFESKEIELTIVTKLLQGPTGIQQLRSVLEALLGIDNTYLVVNGGFNGPYELPGNVCRRAGVPETSRGTEGCCVWAYETLEKRRLLKGAHIPDWFHTEEWLKLYREHGKKK